MPESSKKTAKVEAAAVGPTPTKALKKGTREAEESIKKSVVAAAKKKEETSSDDDENSDEEDAAPSKTVQKPVTKKKDQTSEESESEEESDGDEPQKKTTKSQAAAKKSSSSGDESDEEEEKPAKTPKKTPMPRWPWPSRPEESFSELFPVPEGSFSALFPASKTLFVGNLPTSARLVDLENFFKPAGKVVNHMFSEGRSEFFCNAFVALATSEAAEKALELNGEELQGSKIWLGMDGELEDYGSEDAPAHLQDPLWEWSRDSYSREPLSGGVALFSGFSILDGEAEIKSYVANTFKNSSATPKVTIPKEKDGSLMRFAYLIFPDEDTMIKALYLNGSEVGKSTFFAKKKVGKSTYYIDGPVEYQQEN